MLYNEILRVRRNPLPGHAPAIALVNCESSFHPVSSLLSVCLWSLEAREVEGMRYGSETKRECSISLKGRSFGISIILPGKPCTQTW